MLPLGGRGINRTAAKWRRKIRNRVQQKEQWIHGRNSGPDCVPEGYLSPAMPVPTTKFGAWANIVQANRLIDLPNTSTIFNTRKLTNMVKFAISDSGASAHFLLEGAQ